MSVLFAALIVFSSVVGPAMCSVLGHECATDLTCPALFCEDVYETGILFENFACPSCPVCIDNTIPLDEFGCPDRKEMCTGATPENCKAQRIFEYNGRTCNYCDVDICINESNTQFVGANKK